MAEPIVTGFYHEDGTACPERVCLRPHPVWESPWSREVEMTVFPLACDWCKHEPATYLAVYDVTAHGQTDRVQKVIGGTCVKRDWHHAVEVAVSPRSAWLFRLVPDNGGGCNG